MLAHEPAAGSPTGRDVLPLADRTSVARPDPLALALAALDRPIGVVRSLGREKWEQVDPDVLDELAERITRLSAEANATEQRLLTVIREFDRLEGWKAHGFASCASWLLHRTGIDKVTARERVRVARALGERPLTDQAMGEGRLSFSKVRAITRAPAEDEAELLEHAKTMTAAELEKLVRSWRRAGSETDEERAERIRRGRTLSIFPDDDGGYVIHGKLEPEVAALVMRTLERASDALYRGSVPEVEPAQRRADALALMAERAMAAGFGGVAGEPEASGGDDGASAEAPSNNALAVPERYTVMLHVHENVKKDGAGAHLDDGTRVSAEAARRLSCDAGVLEIVHRKGGRIVEIRGKRQTVPPRLRRALEVRDGGCRFPGCGCRFTEPHHVIHWAGGGPTELDNLVSLCRTHHHLLHEGGFRMKSDPRRPGRPSFYDPRGYRIPELPPEMTIDGKPMGKHSLPRWEHDVPLSFYLRALDRLCR